MTPERVAELHPSRGEAQVIDVREDHEHEAGHVAGDRHIVLPEPDRRGRRASTRTGRSSSTAAADRAPRWPPRPSRASGYDAYNLEGGFVAWLEKGLPAEPEGAVAARQSVFIN